MIKETNITWLHYLLFSSHLKWVRYILICSLLFLFSLGDIGFQYQNSKAGLITFSILCLASTLCKVIPVFLLIKIVMPQLLPSHQYSLFWSITFIVLIFSLLSQHALEFMTCYFSGIPFWRLEYGERFDYYLLDFAVQLVQWFIVFMGLSMGYLLRYWTNEKSRMQKIQASKLQMESELLKEQISPQQLCGTLHHSGELAISQPQQASQRLMLLSQLLRYQLYDCRRRNVLLDGEVKFLKDYMQLNKLNGVCSDYSLKVEGSSYGVFVPPLLFIALLSNIHGEANMLFDIHEQSITFCIEHEGEKSMNDNDEHRLRRRLHHLFDDDFSLDIDRGCSKIRIPI